MCITCGIPSITLEGTRDDWERVLKRIDRLYDLGDEPSAWANMLRPILGRFVSAFDGEPDVEFWKHVVYRDQPMCGRDDMSGWLTAFCVWSHEGTWKAGPLEPLLAISKGVQSGDDRKAEEGRATGSVLSLRSPRKLGWTFVLEWTTDVNLSPFPSREKVDRVHPGRSPVLHDCYRKHSRRLLRSGRHARRQRESVRLHDGSWTRRKCLVVVPERGSRRI